MDKFIVRNEADLFVTGEIGWDFTAESFMRELSSIPSDEVINVHIFSGGGSVFDALAVYDFVRLKGIKFNAFISGLSGSAATIIGAAAERTEIGANSFFFVHRAFNAGVDSSPETLKALDSINERIINIYKDLTGLTKPKIKQLLDAGDKGALLSSKEAITLGFVDAMFKEAQLAASMDWHKEYVNNKSNNMDNSINVDELKTGLLNDVKEFVNNLFTAKEKQVSDEALENAVKSEVDVRLDEIVNKYDETISNLTSEKETLVSDFENKIKELEDELSKFKAEPVDDTVKADAEPNPSGDPVEVSEWDALAAKFVNQLPNIKTK